jgi:hypothetical protein
VIPYAYPNTQIRDAEHFSSAAFSNEPHSAQYKSVCSGRPGAGKNVVMKNLMFANRSYVDSESITTEPSRQFLTKKLARVIAINLICLVVFVAFCAVMTFGSLFRLLALWNEHRAASVIMIMIMIVSIPGSVEFAASRLRIWQG